MQFTVYIPLIALFFILIIMRKKQKTMIAEKLIKKRKMEANTQMLELAKRFVDKKCVIYSFNDNQFTGVIKEVVDGAVLIENNGAVEAINLDFVVRIREYPKNKKGKDRSVVLD